MAGNERERAIEAVDILTDLIADCTAPVNVFKDYLLEWKDDETRQSHLTAVYRLCMSQIVLGLYKWVEFYDKYHDLIPEDMRNECKMLVKRIKARDIEYFRNSCIGHIWNREKNRPLLHSEIERLLKRITLGHAGKFMKWVNDPEKNSYPTTVVSIVETLRDIISTTYSISYAEITTK
jgi:hypothetical protein